MIQDFGSQLSSCAVPLATCRLTPTLSGRMVASGTVHEGQSADADNFTR